MGDKTSPAEGPQPLSETDKARFQALLDVIRGAQPGYRAAVVAATLDGEPVATVALVQEDVDGGATVYPVAVLLTETMAATLLPVDMTGVEVTR